MIEWLLRRAGATDDMLARVDQVQLAFQRPLVLWAGVPAAALAGYFVVRRQRANLPTVSPPLRGALDATRIIVLLLLLWVLSGPYLRLDYELDKRPIVGVLLDQSQSMRLPAGSYSADAAKIAQAAGYPVAGDILDPGVGRAFANYTRWQLAGRILTAQTETFYRLLAERFEVRAYAFADNLLPLPLDGRLQMPAPPAQGAGATWLGETVAKLLEESAGAKLAGIIMVSDGQSTGGKPLAEAAKAAGEAGVPIFAVPAGAAERLRDVSIIDAYASDMASVGDTARVSVTIESHDFDGRAVKVELFDGPTRLDSKDLVLRGTEQQHVDLDFVPKKAGVNYLSIQVAPLAEESELLRTNNTEVARVRVSDAKLRVLYLEGLPRWDFRFLKNAMRRDHGLAGKSDGAPDIILEAERRRLSPSRTPPLPATLEELTKYHVVLLGDVSPDLVTPAFVKLLAEAVREKGLGLIVQAGPNHMPHRFADPLRDLLPVRLRNTAGIEAPVYNPFRLELSPEGAGHEAMRLYDDIGRNLQSWNKMPAFYWCAAVERPAPAASVLAFNSSVQSQYGKLPLIGFHFAGRGRVMFVGTDSTFLWRQNVGDRFFYKFWGQSLRFVARRDDAASGESSLEVQPLRAQPGDESRIELLALSTDGSPRPEPKLPVRILVGDETRTVDLTADPATKGRFTGGFTPQTTGEHRIVFDSGAGETIEAYQRVSIAAEELRHPNVNREALELLAAASGGRVVELYDLPSIPKQLKGDVKVVAVHRETTIWDNWLTVMLVIVVYSVDVGLRRLAGLS